MKSARCARHELKWTMRLSVTFLPASLCWWLAEGLLSPSAMGRTRLALARGGYIAPELDPEYSDRVPRTNLLNINSTLPTPKEGDIVQCSTSWGVRVKNWEDFRLGRIRFLRYNSDRKQWIADVAPLEEGKSDRVFVVGKDAKTFFEPVSTLKPVQSFYLRSEDGYKVAFKKNSTEIALKAVGYRSLNESFVPPAQKSVDLATLRDDLESYSSLKSR